VQKKKNEAEAAVSSNVGSLPAARGVATPSNVAVDRWFFAAMAALFVVTVLVGFVPSSVEKVAAVQAGQRAAFSPVLHAHAVMMGAWLLLLLTQTLLVSSGRVAVHRRLGVLSFVLAPAVVLVMILQTRTPWLEIMAIPPGAVDANVLADTKAIVANILLEQIRCVVLFSLFFGWAVGVRRTDFEMHKRMMLLATLMPLSAAIDRIAQRWLPTTLPTGYEAEYGYLLLWLAPLLIYDVIRYGRVHRAYVIALACLAPFAVANYFLWGSPQWLKLAPAIVGVDGW
jgi:hypothetical protein